MISSLWNTRTTTATPKYKNYQHRVAWSDSQKVLALALHSSHFFIISTFTVLNSVHHASVSKKIHSDKKKARGLPRNVDEEDCCAEMLTNAIISKQTNKAQTYKDAQLFQKRQSNYQAGVAKMRVLEEEREILIQMSRGVHSSPAFSGSSNLEALAIEASNAKEMDEE
ncbi:hypothetical protein HN51_018821 [Arachis hypogaea]